MNPRRFAQLFTLVALGLSGAFGAGAQDAAPPLRNAEYETLVDGLDEIVGFDTDTPKNDVLAFKKLVSTDIPSKGEAILPYLWDKMQRTQHPRVFTYAVMSLAKIEGLTRNEQKDLDGLLKDEFPQFHGELRNEESRLRVVYYLKGFFAGRDVRSGMQSGEQMKADARTGTR